MTTTATRKPRVTDEEKRARREAKKQANLTILGRAVFKATSAVLFGVEDRNNKVTEIFHLTMIDGKVRSCVSTTTGETCDGRHWSGRCCHETRVLAYEAQRQRELAVAEQVAPLVLADKGSFASEDLTAHIDGTLATQPEPLARVNMSKFAVTTPGYQPHETACDCGADGWQQHYKREAEVYKAEQARKDAEQEMYRNMYPGDYGYYDDVA